jgi:chromosome segregation ATPase
VTSSTAYRCTTCDRTVFADAAELQRCTARNGQAWQRIERYCTRCGERYGTGEPCCPRCRNPEFSLNPVSQSPVPEESNTMVATATKPKKAGKKHKAPKKPKATKSELLEEAADLLKRIEKAEERCQEALRTMQDLKDQYKEAKERYNGAVSDLRRLARARKEKLPLFDQAAKTAAKPADASTDPAAIATDPEIVRGKLEGLWHDPSVELNETEEKFVDDVLEGREKLVGIALDKALDVIEAHAKPAAAEPGDAWKSHTLDKADFKPNHRDALEAAGVHTLGELQAKMNGHGQFWAKELRINGKFREPIEDAFNAYLMTVTAAA